MGLEMFDEGLARLKLDEARNKSPLAENIFVILFTPRSGSSWLTDICERTKRLSRPDECFNPNFMPEMTRALGARNMEEYVELLRRRRNTKNVYGCQLTYYQLEASFNTEQSFVDIFGGAKFFWLVRKNIIAQSISLAKMVSTSISHAPLTSPEAIEIGDSNFGYSRTEIRRWLQHISSAEEYTEGMIEKFGLNPMRLSYEGLTGMGAGKSVQIIADHVGAQLSVDEQVVSGHRKIATKLNASYEERFRNEELELVSAIEERRAAMISKIEH